MFQSYIGSIANQFYRGTPPPIPSITVDNIIVNTSGTRIITSYTTSGSSEKNQLPIAFGVQINGRINVGQAVTTSWQYFHVNNSAQGSSVAILQQADDIDFTVNVTQLSTTFPYTFLSGSRGKYVRSKITPITIDGTPGDDVYSAVKLVGNTIVQRKINVSLGSAGSPTVTSSETWNHCYTDNPDATYSFSPLVRSDGVTTSFSLAVDVAMSDNNTGSTLAGINNASEFGAGAARGYWYPAGSPARGFKVLVGSGMGIGTGEVKILSNIASGTNEAFLSVQNMPVGYLHLSNVTASPPSNGNIASFTEVNMTTDILFRSNDGTGLSPINAFIIYYYEELP